MVYFYFIFSYFFHRLFINLAQQNAHVVVDADRYYRASFFGRNSWNVRDEHMMDTLDRYKRKKQKIEKKVNRKLFIYL